MLWVVRDAVTVLTNAGRTLRLDLDPLAVLAKEIKARWRWRTVEGSHHSLDSGGARRRATMDPIWKLLRSSENSENWKPSLRGALLSAIADRQWPQVCCLIAGFAQRQPRQRWHGGIRESFVRSNCPSRASPYRCCTFTWVVSME